MKKISLLLMLFFTSVLMLNVQAAPVDSLTAKDLARTFWGNVAKTPVRNLQNMPVKIVYKAMSDVSAAGRESSVCYYIINVGQKGFVILAGDDRITPILGYSTESRFVTEGMPENITYWLDARRKEISYALSEGCLTSTSEIAYQWENLSEMGATKSVVVSPLLQTSWNQDTYYNQFCPSDASGPGGHAYAGCVATAMAQVIRFWQWPNSGFNTHSYTCDYGTLSVDFGSVTHNYNNMPNSLSSSTSSTQCNAVATLIYHCGVSVNMNYGANGSGASSVNVPSALVNYFAYPEGMEYVYRDNYSDNDWNTLIRNELNEGHPVYYDGSGTGGHAFVCDGYDNNGSYHFNWGWGSYCNNGYFTLDALTPCGYNFSYEQGAIIGLSVTGAFLRCSTSEMLFSAPLGGESDAQTVVVRGHSLSSSINVAAGNGYTVSTDGTNFYNNVSLSSSGGTVYVKYTPVSAGEFTNTLSVTSGNCSASVTLHGISSSEVCIAPKNLVGSFDGSNVNLSWNVPVSYSSGSPASATLSWDAGNTISSYYSYGAVSYCMVHRFVPSDLTPYNQYLLKTVSFIASPYATSYSIVVFKGGGYNSITGVFNPGVDVVNQLVPMSTVNTFEWNTVSLVNPILVDATSELWFGVIVNGSYVIPEDSSAVVTNKGNLIGFLWNEGDTQYSWYNGYEFNIPIKGTVEKISGQVSRYDVYRQSTLIGNTTNTAYTDNSPQSGNTLYTVYAVWNNNCSESASVTVNVPVMNPPTVTTNDVTNVSFTSADCGGQVVSAGGLTVTARGVCWSTSQNPTISDAHTTDGSGIGAFTSSITGLQPGATYYVRAYATNNAGTAYGSEVSFTTLDNTVPAGDAQPCPGHETVTDFDGNTYNTVKIGNQCWMKENLRVQHYEDGVEIPLGNTSSNNVAYIYNPANNANNVPTYGYLYNWAAVMRGMASSNTSPSDVQGVCPVGWHVPSDTEWTQLTDYVSSKLAYLCNGNYIAKALASQSGWGSSSNSCAVGNSPSENNATGFSAKPAGRRSSYYASFNSYADFWSSTLGGESTAWSRNLNRLNNWVAVDNQPVTYAFSVRCVLGTGYNLSTVTTAEASDITDNSATCGGNVTYDGNATVTARGVCWSISQNPTIADAHTTDGVGIGAFTSSIFGLESGVTYYVRAYATTSVGTSYGEEVSFTTTVCETITLPYTETFEYYTESTTAATGVQPDCWSMVQEDVAMTNSTRPQLYYKSSFAHSGNYSLKLGNRGVYAMPALSPNIPMNRVKLEMYLRQPNSVYRLQVGVWEDNGTFVPVALINNSTTDVEYVECDFSSYTGNGHRVAFRNVLASGSNYAYSYNYLDDIVLKDLCEPITLPYVETFEDYTQSTTAATGIQPDCWELVHEDVAMTDATRPQLYYKSSFAHSGNYTLKLGNRGVYAMPALESNIPMNQVKLEMYLRQANAVYRLEVGVWEDDGTFVPVALFNNSTTGVEYVECDFSSYTGDGRRVAFRNVLASGSNYAYSYNYIDDIVLRNICEPITLPYIEDFENYTASTATATGVQPDCWELVHEDVAMTDANRPQLCYKSSFAHSGNYSLKMGNRGVYAMPALSSNIPMNQVRLEMYLRQANAAYRLEVGVWEDDGTFVPVALFNNSTTDVEHVECDFSNYTGNGRRIAFHNVLRSGVNYAYSYNYIDDIVLTDISGSSCVITLPYTETFESYTTETTASTGVEPECWELVKEDVAMTAANRPQLYYKSSFAHSGNYSLKMGNRGVYAMSALPSNIPMNQVKLEMYLRQPNAAYRLQVGIWEDNGTFVPVALFDNSTTNVEYVECDFSNYMGNGHRIAFRNVLRSGVNYSYSYNYLDDITLTRITNKGAEVTDAIVSNADMIASDRNMVDITVYPNPTKDYINVECTIDNELLEVKGVEVIDVYGKVVRTDVETLRATSLPTRINVSGLAAGMYFVRVTTDKGAVTKPFVKR